jgi:hypothetical protein
MRLFVLAICLALTVAGCFGAGGRSSSTAASMTQSVPLRACRGSELEITLVRSFVAAGNVGGSIGFTNHAANPCNLTGWPRLVAVTKAGISTRAKRVRSTMFGPRPGIVGVPVVKLRHGERAEAVFAASDIPGPGETSCPPPYRRLRVTPPGNSKGPLLSAWLPNLDAYLPSCSRVVVTMMVSAAELGGG